MSEFTVLLWEDAVPRGSGFPFGALSGLGGTVPVTLTGDGAEMLRAFRESRLVSPSEREPRDYNALGVLADWIEDHPECCTPLPYALRLAAWARAAWKARQVFCGANY